MERQGVWLCGREEELFIRENPDAECDRGQRPLLNAERLGNGRT